MASCTCHVLCVTKRRRLERLVRPQHATTVRRTQAFALGVPRSPERRRAAANCPPRTRRSQGLPPDAGQPTAWPAAKYPKTNNRTADLSRAATDWPKHKDDERRDGLTDQVRPLLLAFALCGLTPELSRAAKRQGLPTQKWTPCG